MKKALYVASKVKLHINLFHVPFLLALKEKGFEVHVCARNDYNNKEDCIIPGCDHFINLPFNRIPIHPSNLKVYYRLKRIINQNDYDMIHCHTPIGGAIARLASRKARKQGTKVIYTAHGFHFYKNAPTINNLIYQPAERFLSHMTDAIITMNEEDFENARKFRCPTVVKMNGVGIDIKKYTSSNQKCAEKIKHELNISNEATVLYFAGELSHRKHQDFLIDLMTLLCPANDVHLLLVGEGDYRKKYEKLAKESGCSHRIHFLGFRKDIGTIIKTSDICVSSARQEGLPVNIMEAMAGGLPVVCFDIRGNNDLIIDGKGGFLVKLEDLIDFSRKVQLLIESKDLRRKLGLFNIDNVGKYERENVVADMMKLYNKVLNE